MTEKRPIPISVLVQTKNEELGIVACLDGLKDFEEIIVVDSNSADRTADLARRHGATVVEFTWDGRYPKKKQWQLDNVATRHHWILFIDADETPSADLVEELRALMGSDLASYAAFDIKLDYVFCGKQLRYGHRVSKRALLHRDRVKFPVFDDLGMDGMGELEGHYQPNVFGNVRKLQSRLLHNDLDPVTSWFTRHNRYSDWEAKIRSQPDTRLAIARSKTRQGKLFDAVPGKPLAFFIYSYILRGGFLDGRPGLDYALALSFYYWQISVKRREIGRLDGRP